LRSIKKKDKDSVSVENVIERHSSDFKYDRCNGFRMNICETHKSAFERPVTEAVKIDLSDCQTMNNKTDFKTNTVYMPVLIGTQLLTPHPPHHQLTAQLGLRKSFKRKMRLFKFRKNRQQRFKLFQVLFQVQ